MAEPFLSEIRIFSFNFPPKGWALCNGQLLPINQNQALFSLLGTMYGGDGQTNFALPHIRGRVPIHEGKRHTLGEGCSSTAVTVNHNSCPLYAFSHNTWRYSMPTQRHSGASWCYKLAQYEKAKGLQAYQTRNDPQAVGKVGGNHPKKNSPVPCPNFGTHPGEFSFQT